MNNDIYKRIINEYNFKELDIFDEDDNRLIFTKQAIKQLSQSDHIIILLYAELGSLRKVGKELGISHTIIYKEIKRIREEIYNIIKKLEENDISKFDYANLDNSVYH
jgi:DNA-directed RNA polymerase specialized sigma subunit